ncbi:flagellar filament capping protein FliD [Stutzerimonas azotifigens]|uniref:Flagellar hook-associated protein 2 n=1 Tax=Stutzerimonas azotifigens TaxID=291995 RepID=A0ABR5Z4Z9_9GAMM|nr:flagellar filament capping protein FliD [Stutzerimonas azotifigens]MBA1275206.1 flagellar filament capping protein FliD [Stutzerimonas azotifigens]
MAGITGIGSGMDIKGMVDVIVAAERAPKAGQLATLEKKTTTQLTSLGQLKSAISNFQSALSALNSPSSFLARTATSSDSKVITASASQSAQAGNYKVDVQQLASSSKVALAAIDGGAKLNSGTLNIKVGGTALPDITIDSSNNTLTGIRDAINEAGKSEGVSATIITDDHGSRLVLSSSKAGEGNDITVAVNETGVEEGHVSLSELAYSGPTAKPSADDFGGEDDPAYISALAAYEKGSQTLATAQSAKLTIDGLAVTRDSNSIDDVVGGLSFDIKSTGSSTLSVTKDEAGVEANVQKFVEAYNTLMTFINTETKVTTVNETSAPVVGALVGDASARSLVNAIRSELVSPQGDGAIRALADMGITTKKDGTLEMDGDKVKKAISTDFEGVAAYFTGDSGLATRLGDKLKPYTDGGGILESRTTSLQATLDKVDKQKEDLDTRIKALEERLYKQYNAMDSLVAQLMSTSDSLTQLFDSMPGFVTQKT